MTHVLINILYEEICCFAFTLFNLTLFELITTRNNVTLEKDS